MDTKELILNSIVENLQPLVPNHKLIARNDHGCWEIISRGLNGMKVLECIMAEDYSDDNVYVHFNENYDKPAEPISLANPDSLEKLFALVQKGLGYV